MTFEKVRKLTEKARNLSSSNLPFQAEEAYLEVIDILKTTNKTNSEKAMLWTTKAEYLNFRATFLLEGETVEDSRKRLLEAIQLLYKTSKLSKNYKSQVEPNITKLIKHTIIARGCIIPENGETIHISCPINIRNIGAGQIGFSIGLYYEKAACSICGLDILLDSKCNHIIGKKYGDQICHIKAENLVMDHVSLTPSPKDPNCKITELWIPKRDFYKDFKKEELQEKERKKLPLICNICKLKNIDPKEIDIIKFFQMQNLVL